MKVWAVCWAWADEWDIEGIYTSEELAKEKAPKGRDGEIAYDHFIREYEVKSE